MQLVPRCGAAASARVRWRLRDRVCAGLRSVSFGGVRCRWFGGGHRRGGRGWFERGSRVELRRAGICQSEFTRLRFGERGRTSRRRIKSLIMLITFPIVPSAPPSPLSGCANSMFWPLRSNPLERSWLFMYRDAVFRLSDSIAFCRFVEYLTESHRMLQPA